MTIPVKYIPLFLLCVIVGFMAAPSHARVVDGLTMLRGQM